MFSKNQPYAIPVEAAKTTYLCTCGNTANAPFCDGAHTSVEGAAPFAYTPDESGTAYICGCGKSGNGSMCDGSHQ